MELSSWKILADNMDIVPTLYLRESHIQVTCTCGYTGTIMLHRHAKHTVELIKPQIFEVKCNKCSRIFRVFSSNKIDKVENTAGKATDNSSPRNN